MNEIGKQLGAKVIEEFGSPLCFMTRFNPIFQDKLESIGCGYVGCYKLAYPTLSAVVWGYGIETVKTWLAVYIDNLVEMLGVPSRMEEKEKDYLAGKIIYKYHQLKISEIALYFSKMKDAELVEYYGYIDASRVMAGLRVYVQRRDDTVERHERADQRDQMDKRWREQEQVRCTREEYQEIKKKRAKEFRRKERSKYRFRLRHGYNRCAVALARYIASLNY